MVIRCYDEHRDLERLAELFHILDLAIENYPADPCGNCCSSHLRKGRPSDGLENDSIRAGTWIGLYKLQDLLALQNAVGICVQDFDVHAQLSSRILGSRSLFDLVVIVLRDQRDYNAESLHIPPCGCPIIVRFDRKLMMTKVLIFPPGSEWNSRMDIPVRVRTITFQLFLENHSE